MLVGFYLAPKYDFTSIFLKLTIVFLLEHPMPFEQFPFILKNDNN